MDSGAGRGPESRPEPELHITPEVLADLQAGLLDDATAGRVRRHARSDPDAARTLADLDAVRRDLARLASDERSAPEVPAAVTARVGAALRAAPPPPSPGPGGHALARPTLSRGKRAGVIAGICVVAAVIVLLLIAAAAPQQIRAGIVEPTCAATHPGLLVETVPAAP